MRELSRCFDCPFRRIVTPWMAPSMLRCDENFDARYVATYTDKSEVVTPEWCPRRGTPDA